MCFETTCNEMTRTTFSIIDFSPCNYLLPNSTSTDQRLSKLDTRLSRFSRHFLASILKGVKCWVPCSLYRSLGPFFTVLNSTLVDKILLTFASSLCTISSSFWWHTSGENIDAYGGTNQQQQVSHCWG